MQHRTRFQVAMLAKEKMQMWQIEGAQAKTQICDEPKIEIQFSRADTT